MRDAGHYPQPDSDTGRFPLLTRRHRRLKMLRWALGFFIVALIAGLLGFTGISLAAAGIAKILFYLFLILFLVTLMGHLLRRSCTSLELLDSTVLVYPTSVPPRRSV